MLDSVKGVRIRRYSDPYFSRIRSVRMSEHKFARWSFKSFEDVVSGVTTLLDHDVKPKVDLETLFWKPLEYRW